MKKKDFIVDLCLLLLALLYIAHNSFLSEFDQIYILEGLLSLIGLYVALCWYFKEIESFKQDLSLKNFKDAPYFYARHRKVFGAPINKIHGEVLIAYHLSILCVLPFVHIHQEVWQYLQFLKAITLPVLFLLTFLSLVTAKKFVSNVFILSTIILGMKIFLLPSSHNTLHINTLHLTLFTCVFSILYFTFHYFCMFMSSVMRSFRVYEKEFKKTQHYKKHPEHILQLLKSQPKIQPLNKENSFFVGQPTAEINITVILNLFCRKSEECFREVYDLIQDHENEINLNFVFNFHIYRDEVQRNIIRSFVSNYLEGKDISNILQQCFMNNFEFHKHQFAGAHIDSKYIEEIIDYHLQWCKSNRIVEAPVRFLNCRKIPSDYSISDVLID